MEPISFLQWMSYIKSGSDVLKFVTESKLTPFFLTFLKDKSSKSKLSHNLKSYYDRSVQQTAYVNTIVFQNEPKFINDIYVPLTLSRIDFEEKFKLDFEFELDVILSFKKLLIKDSAGMGKSTCLKWLYLKTLSNNNYIPFFVDLRHLTESKDVVDLIREELNLFGVDVIDSQIEELLNDKKVIFFLDGLDEIEGEVNKRNKILRGLDSFFKRFSKAHQVMTSRPEDFLIGLKGFSHFEIKKFSKDEAFTLLRKYDESGKVSEKIIDELKKSGAEVKDFLGNPLTISLLFTSYVYTPKISLQRIQFYENIFDALYERHDYSKGEGYCRTKLCTVNKHDFLRVLSFVGVETALTLKKVSFSYAELSSIVDASKKYFNIDFDVHYFIKDLKTSVPIMNEDGTNIKWSHKAFQDFYAAYFFRYHFHDTEKKFTVLKKLSKVGSFSNLLDLYRELDLNGFKKNVLKSDLLNVLALKAQIDEKIKFPGYSHILATVFFENSRIQFCHGSTTEEEDRSVIEELLKDLSIKKTLIKHMSASFHRIRNGETKDIVIVIHENGICIPQSIRFSPNLLKPTSRLTGEEIVRLKKFLSKNQNLILTLDDYFRSSDESLFLIAKIALEHYLAFDFDAIKEEVKLVEEIEKNESVLNFKL